MIRDLVLGLMASGTGMLVLIALFGAWVTHCATCIMGGSWFLLIMGAIVAPVGVVHGWLIWCGLA